MLLSTFAMNSNENLFVVTDIFATTIIQYNILLYSMVKKK